MRPGDWNCPSCQHLNFSRRDTCQRCSESRPGDQEGKGSASQADDWLPGDGSYGKGRAGDAQSRRGGGGGYGFGSSYNEVGRSSSGGLRPGDWYCPASSCGAHNFASRSSCYKCGEYKDEGASGVGGAGRGPRGNYGFGAGGGSGSGSANSRQGWKAGDWICNRFKPCWHFPILKCGAQSYTIVADCACARSGCTEHNFASRMECYRCNAPRQPEYEVAAM